MDSILNLYYLKVEENFPLFWAKEILISVLIFGFFWGLSLLLQYLLQKVAPRFTAYDKTGLLDRILQRIAPPSGLLVIFAGLYFAVHSLPFPDRVQVVVTGTIFMINVVIFTNIAYRAIHETLAWYAARVSERTGSGPDRQIMPLVEKVILIFLVGAALIVILKHFNYDILSLVTALGIGSLAIGLAAKDTLANMISGFTLMIDRPFRIGDRIQLVSGQWGDVVDVGLRSTKIQTADNTVLIIPNSELCNSSVINMAFPDVRGKGRINVSVTYGSDVHLVKNLLVEIAREVDDVLVEPAPEAFLVSFGDSALNMALFFWVKNYTRLFSVTDILNTKIITRFKESGINIPYPTRTVLLEKEG